MFTNRSHEAIQFLNETNANGDHDKRKGEQTNYADTIAQKSAAEWHKPIECPEKR